MAIGDGWRDFVCEGWHDDPDIMMISQTSQGLLADLLRKVWESEATEEELQVAAEFCGFRYLREYLAFVKAPQPKGADWYPKWEQFISGIDAKEMG